MSEEKFEKSEKECKCFCQSKYFKKFLVVVFGSFVGVYFALSLFTLVHRPPIYQPYGFAPMPMHHYMNNCPCKHFKDKMKHYHKDFKKEVQQDVEDKD